MAKRKLHGHPVLILGAGRGGSALLEMFLEDDLVEVVAVADPDPLAPGMKLAGTRGIPVYTDSREAVLSVRGYPDCIVYNLTHDDTVGEMVGEVLGARKVTSGPEAKLFWQMVTNLKRIREELEKSQNQLKAIIYHAMDGIITINESDEIQAFNPAAEKIFGYSQQQVLGKHIRMLVPEPIRSDRQSGTEVMAVRKNGDAFPAELSISEMTLSGQRYFISIVRDITERKAAEQKIMHLAHHDHLTNLPNRALFLDRLDQSVNLAGHAGKKAAVLFIDLDGFKLVNDRLGHDAGDLLLQNVASNLVRIVRASDTVARVGGDEFTVVLNQLMNRNDASFVAEKIISALSACLDLDGAPCTIGCSIGIAMFPEDSENPKMLLKKADEAMYFAKQGGKNRYVFHSGEAIAAGEPV